MRNFSIIMAVVTAIVLLVVGYAFITANVGVAVLSITSEPAANQYEAFTMASTWASQNDNDSVIKFKSDGLSEISNYSMVYLTVEVNNWNFMPAEWVQLHVKPAEGDVLQIRQDSGTAKSMGKTTFQAVVVSDNSNPTIKRQVEVEYYIFGKKYTVVSPLVQE